jgi:hypothetical protein
MESRPVWKVEQNQNYQRGRAAELITSWTIRYIPPEKVDADGKTRTRAMNFPALVITNWVGDPDKVAAQVAHRLNTYPDLLEALKALAIESGGKAIPNSSLTTCREQALAVIAAADAPIPPAGG